MHQLLSYAGQTSQPGIVRPEKSGNVMLGYRHKKNAKAHPPWRSVILPVFRVSLSLVYLLLNYRF